MDEEREWQLVDKYPNLYKDYGGDPSKTAMYWGFCCGDGWFDIIDRLSAFLEKKGVVAEQVKEKFGGLRFYISSGDKETFDAIDAAEAESYKTCEVCGKPGELRGRAWVKTLCEECWQKELDYGQGD